MARKRLIDDQNKFFDWLDKCPYSFKYRYEMDGTIILTFRDEYKTKYWHNTREKEDVGMD